MLALHRKSPNITPCRRLNKLVWEIAEPLCWSVISALIPHVANSVHLQSLCGGEGYREQLDPGPGVHGVSKG